MYGFRSIGFLSLGLAVPLVQAAQCLPTPPMHRGGHYVPNAPLRGDVGSGLVVQGRVLGAGDCSPVAGAKIDHWQADAHGVYVERLRGVLFADAQGAYRFETEWPGAPVPHLHFIVSAPGYQTLVTQWVGDEPVARVRLDFVLRAKR